jgi:hypothetical protein
MRLSPVFGVKRRYMDVDVQDVYSASEASENVPI